MSGDGKTGPSGLPAAARIAPADPRDAAARDCLRQYYDELARRFPQGFDVSLSRDPEADDMVPPRGVFLIAWSGDLPIGCAGLKGLGRGEAEVKRVWVAPAARGHGLSRRLMDEIEARAVDLGIHRLMLDTNSTLAEAVALYRKTGWTRIDRFNDDPYPDMFFEKQLQMRRP
ncbi:GNAT family N-acetyltransferase [Paracoccus sp. YIM 132242]|uniref:GNAT family N-acetyltransferase n=1 Tax=Paracoccus lichenicola TaxID=2665644 RepID=A0A6L6HM13_9RHOB|nr:GNAT family N-acetyltransferase [Paracoccus lichenicola]MTD99124.1 GNAT family N-acetyltransferase [Paracoccus lichenicola]